jgi:hypothetical protein
MSLLGTGLHYQIISQAIMVRCEVQILTLCLHQTHPLKTDHITQLFSSNVHFTTSALYPWVKGGRLIETVTKVARV